MSIWLPCHAILYKKKVYVLATESSKTGFVCSVTLQNPFTNYSCKFLAILSTSSSLPHNCNGRYMIKLPKAKLWSCETRRVSSDKSEPQSRTRSQRFLARVEWPIDYLKCPSPHVQMCASGNPFWINDAVLPESGSISWRAEHCLRQMGRTRNGGGIWETALRCSHEIRDEH